MFIRVTEKAKLPVTTKRELLRLTASVFDPFGLVSPFVLKGRQLFQTANEIQEDFDKRLPEDLIDEINVWKDSMVNLDRIRIKRWTNTDNLKLKRVDLCLLCDTSFDGYGFVGYIRRYDEDEQDV